MFWYECRALQKEVILNEYASVKSLTNYTTRVHTQW